MNMVEFNDIEKNNSNERQNKTHDITTKMLSPANIISNGINNFINSKAKQRFSSTVEMKMYSSNELKALIICLKDIDKHAIRNIASCLSLYNTDITISKFYNTTSLYDTNIYVHLGNGVILKVSFIITKEKEASILLNFYGPVYKTIKYKEIEFINKLCKLCTEISNKYTLDNCLGLVQFKYTNGDMASSSSTIYNLRRFESVFFNDRNNIKKIDSFLDNFLNKYSKFKKYNLPFKTGIMIHGLPGTGKSTLALAIASELLIKMNKYKGVHIVYIDMTHIKMCVNILKDLMSLASDIMCVIVLEDIDYIFNKREDNKTLEEKENANNLLQVLDGYLSMEGSVCIATTNYYDRLDDAIIRPGRFNLTIEMDYLEKPAAIEMCKYYEADPEKVLKEVNKFPVSPAYLQGIILKYM